MAADGNGVNDPGEPGRSDDVIRLTAGAVARRLGVAVTTLRTWDRRYGLGPTDHTAGTHRRYSADDVRRLETMRSLTFQGVPPGDAARAALTGDAPVVEVPVARHGGGRVIPVGRARAASRGLARAASSMDSEAMGAIVRESIVAHGTVETWDHVLTPVLIGVGQRWESDHRWIEVEHLLSWHVSSELRAVPYGGYGAPPTPPSVSRVLLASIEEEQHTLALEALSAALREAGVGSRIFGARVPAHALMEAVRRTGPAIVALWAQMPATAHAEVFAQLAALSRPPRAAALGPGWRGSTFPPEVARPSSLGDAVETVLRALPPEDPSADGPPLPFPGG